MNAFLKRTLVAQAGAAIAIALSSIDVAPAHALAIDASPTGLANPAQTIDFSDLAGEAPAGTTALTNQYSSAGVTFSNLYFVGSADFDISSFGEFPYQDPASAFNITSFSNGMTTVNPFSIQFTSPQTRAAFKIYSSKPTVTFTALLNGTPIESFTSSSIFDMPGDYYGFTGVTFDQIQIAVGGAELRAAGISSLQFGEATPVPFGFTPLPGLAVSGLLCGINRLRKRFA
ncbi:hypothetical protein Q2T42_26730 [Leptolyngbya boryana CZ1]|uniref:PEP-CTERM sorting domain-containing protein n=1 Tax=Leptolyngbya boryana CZ1 TaxID=3060204 RepID=A0AA96WW88_LEPBY|nr:MULTISPECIES: hypothetical protein [Leptolyngbya]MBD1856943.1 hypothetical protein [Leptolyngbya sp. FACHB-1624]WNZ45389.1 hypothetical protein Q2T42_26730 [Leptolyngbya boryana CZ1]